DELEVGHALVLLGPVAGSLTARASPALLAVTTGRLPPRSIRKRPRGRRAGLSRGATVGRAPQSSKPFQRGQHHASDTRRPRGDLLPDGALLPDPGPRRHRGLGLPLYARWQLPGLWTLVGRA